MTTENKDETQGREGAMNPINGLNLQGVSSGETPLRGSSKEVSREDKGHPLFLSVPPEPQSLEIKPWSPAEETSRGYSSVAKALQAHRRRSADRQARVEERLNIMLPPPKGYYIDYRV